MWAALEELRILNPTFVSVTYGAFGSNRDKTVEVIARIRERTGILPMAHLTGGGHTYAEVGAVLDRFVGAGIEHVLALRGDRPATGWPPSDFSYASDLVRFIRERYPKLSVAGAAYPEGHLEAPTRDVDLEHLKAKVDAGCSFIITQLFFDNALYFDFCTRARARGITVPILPGIMPVTDARQLDRFIKVCGATVPERLRRALERHSTDASAVAQLGIAHATAQCVELLARGAPGIHFYTLNRSKATRLILSSLKDASVRPAPP